MRYREIAPWITEMLGMNPEIDPGDLISMMQKLIPLQIAALRTRWPRFRTVWKRENVDVDYETERQGTVIERRKKLLAWR